MTQSLDAIGKTSWPVIRALLETPATVRELSARTRLPMALIHEELAHLQRHGLLEEAGVRHIGGYRERIYRLADEAASLSATGLKGALETVEQGMLRVAAANGQGFFTLVMKRTSRETADEAYRSLVDLRTRLNKIPETEDQEDGVLLYVALSPWVEDPEEFR